MKTAKKGIRAIKKACREMAHEMMLLEYRKYDDIWWNRIRITPELIRQGGKEIVQEINLKMPTCSPAALWSIRWIWWPKSSASRASATCWITCWTTSPEARWRNATTNNFWPKRWRVGQLRLPRRKNLSPR